MNIAKEKIAKKITKLSDSEKTAFQDNYRKK